MHRQILAAFALVMLVVTSAFADLSVPKLTTRVYDETGTLTPEQKQSLETKLVYYEDSTSTQIVVVLVNTLGGAEVSDYAIETGNQNHIGQSKKNNGVVILLAKNDHQGFIATGYGMEPTVTDAVASVIFRDVLRPALRQNDYYGGISAAIDSIVSASRGEFKGTGTHRSRRNSENGSGFIFFIIIFIVFVIGRAVVGTGLRRTVVGATGANHGFMNGLMSGWFWSNIFRNSGGGGGGSSWGGFGGGGGGFSGGGFSGGGGSFGGGGAGGSW
jgi:uncharacterized protein